MSSLAAHIKDEQMKVGSFITRLRKQKNITQKELAERLQTSQSAVARMEAGDQNFSTEMLLKISDALHQDILTLNKGAVNLKIEGGKQLSGSIKTNVSKNASVGLLCAALLNKGTTTLKRIPRIEEVFRLIEVLESLGVGVEWTSQNDLIITPPKKLKIQNINEESATKTRSIIMFLGPLIHLFDSFELPVPGGCKLGLRTNFPHLYALSKLGVKTEKKGGNLLVTAKDLKAAEIIMYESGDTVTENILMAAAKIDGKTTIKYASPNYMVQEVCFFLEKLGVKIDGIGTTTLVVHGKKDIDQDVTYEPSEDPIESMLFLSIAATTKSEMTILRCPIAFLELELLKLELMGLKYDLSERYKADNGRTELVDITVYPSELIALNEKIYARPYPGINIDNLPFFVPIATQAKGKTLIHDWVFENRAIYYTELAKLGANITLADIHRAYIEGPTELKAAELVCPAALRPAAIILVAMLAAKGHSTLRNIYSINRGYEDLATRLSSLGANVEELRGF